jgi:hypothetical protein
VGPLLRSSRGTTQPDMRVWGPKCGDPVPTVFSAFSDAFRRTFFISLVFKPFSPAFPSLAKRHVFPIAKVEHPTIVPVYHRPRLHPALHFSSKQHATQAKRTSGKSQIDGFRLGPTSGLPKMARTKLLVRPCVMFSPSVCIVYTHVCTSLHILCLHLLSDTDISSQC